MDAESNPEMPENPPKSELFGDGVCNPALPVRDVIESFDFGQFVDLLAVDELGRSQPVILERSALTATAHAMRAVKVDRLEAPLRVVPAEMLGGIPLIDVAMGVRT